jgi:hypothetical protein
MKTTLAHKTKRLLKIVNDFINGPVTPYELYLIEKEITEAHLQAQMRIREYRNDGF